MSRIYYLYFMLNQIGSPRNGDYIHYIQSLTAVRACVGLQSVRRQVLYQLVPWLLRVSKVICRVHLTVHLFCHNHMVHDDVRLRVLFKISS